VRLAVLSPVARPVGDVRFARVAAASAAAAEPAAAVAGASVQVAEVALAAALASVAVVVPLAGAVAPAVALASIAVVAPLAAVPVAVDSPADAPVDLCGADCRAAPAVVVGAGEEYFPVAVVFQPAPASDWPVAGLCLP